MSEPSDGFVGENESRRPVTGFVGVSSDPGRGVLMGTGPYEFFTDDGARVSLHDADLLEVTWRPDATLRLHFVYDREWTPAEVRATPVIELTFSGAQVLRWENEPDPQPDALGQVSAFDWDGRDRFDLSSSTLELSFTADRMTANLLPAVP